MAGQERCQVGGHGDRADPWAATTVGDAERLVKVQVAHIGSESSRARDTDESVEVGAVDVHLPTDCVHHVAEFDNAFFEDTVG